MTCLRNRKSKNNCSDYFTLVCVSYFLVLNSRWRHRPSTATMDKNQQKPPAPQLPETAWCRWKERTQQAPRSESAPPSNEVNKDGWIFWHHPLALETCFGRLKLSPWWHRLNSQLVQIVCVGGAEVLARSRKLARWAAVTCPSGECVVAN